jgi:hypothetical protein
VFDLSAWLGWRFDFASTLEIDGAIQCDMRNQTPESPLDLLKTSNMDP